VLFEAGPKMLHRFHDVCVDGVRRNVHHVGNGVVAQPVHPAEGDGLALSVGQFINPGVEHLLKNLRVHARVGAIRQGSQFPIVKLRFVFSTDALVPVEVVYLAARDLKDVRGQVVHLVEVLSSGPQARECVLSNVVCGGVRPGHASHVAKDLVR